MNKNYVHTMVMFF